MDEKGSGGFSGRVGKGSSRILMCVDEGLASFGKEIPMTARFYLESRYQIVPEVIVHDPKRFVQGLRELFGIGSKLVEEIIAKSICKKYGLKENKDLVQVIHEANHVDSW